MLQQENEVFPTAPSEAERKEAGLGQAKGPGRRLGGGGGGDTQTRLGMREGQRRVDIQAPQTLWSRGAALQTFYELGLTREEEWNWFHNSPELHGIMETSSK